MIDFGEIATQALRALLEILVPVLVAFLFAQGAIVLRWAKRQYESNVQSSERAAIEAVVRVGVTMVEQAWNRPDVQKALTSKREMAYSYIDAALSARGLKISSAEIYALIESSVFTEINREQGRERGADASSSGAAERETPRSDAVLPTRAGETLYP